MKWNIWIWIWGKKRWTSSCMRVRARMWWLGIELHAVEDDGVMGGHRTQCGLGEDRVWVRVWSIVIELSAGEGEGVMGGHRAQGGWGRGCDRWTWSSVWMRVWSVVIVLSAGDGEGVIDGHRTQCRWRRGYDRWASSLVRAMVWLVGGALLTSSIVEFNFGVLRYWWKGWNKIYKCGYDTKRNGMKSMIIVMG